MTFNPPERAGRLKGKSESSTRSEWIKWISGNKSSGLKRASEGDDGETERQRERERERVTRVAGRASPRELVESKGQTINKAGAVD